MDDNELDHRHALILLRAECASLYVRLDAMEAAIGSLALTLLILIGGLLLNFRALPPPR